MENIYAPYAISPVDGRYSEETTTLQLVFSEFALMKNRLIVEVEFLIALITTLVGHKDKYAEPFEKGQEEILRNIYNKFSEEDFYSIKKFEKIGDHDVDAVVRFLKSKLLALQKMEKYATYVHIGRTSEDINNLAYALMLMRGVSTLHHEYEEVASKMLDLAISGANVPMLARTHGQPATPSTVGWTVIVEKERLTEPMQKLEGFLISVKFTGATGGNNAMIAAYPDIDWKEFNDFFISNLCLVSRLELSMVVNNLTFQIEPHDTYKELFEIITGLNTALINFCQNMWMYISQEVFVQKVISEEIGSSTMPQKVNPIKFENAQGNLEYANTMFEFFSRRLPISRGYRDLIDSTIERNFGVAFAHTLIALSSIKKGLNRVKINKDFLRQELENHWEVVTEGYQVILRSVGVEKAYDVVNDKVRGKKVTKEFLHELIDKISLDFNLESETVEKLKSLTPHNYLGNREFGFFLSE